MDMIVIEGVDCEGLIQSMTVDRKTYTEMEALYWEGVFEKYPGEDWYGDFELTMDEWMYDRLIEKAA